MKSRTLPRFSSKPLVLGASLAAAIPSHSATETKAATGTDLSAGASWGDGSAPAVADPAIITWNGTSSGAGLTLTTAATWYGINVEGSADSNIDITGANTLTLGSGGIKIESSGVNTTIAKAIALGSVQTWSAAAGKTLTVSGVVSGSAPLIIGAASHTSQSFLTSTAQNLFAGVSLSNVIATGGIMGGTYVASGSNMLGGGYLLNTSGSPANYWLETVDGGFTKGVRIELAQSGSDITARSTAAEYVSGSNLGYDFNTGGIGGTLAQADGNDGYGAHTTTLITRSSNYTGIVSLGGNNTFSGGLIVEGGTLTGSTGVAFNSTQGGSFGTGAITVNAGGTLTSSGPFVIGGGQNTTRAIHLNGGTLDLKSAGTGGEYIRTINLTGGTVLTSDGGSGGATSDWFRAPNGGTSINSSASANPSTISTRIDLTLGNLSLDTANGAAANDLHLSGNITQNTDAGSGDRTLTKNGAGTLLLSGTNSFTGTVAVNAGTLKIGINRALGVLNTAVTKVTVASGATVDFNGAIDATYGYTISGTGVGGNGALVNNGAAIGNGTAQTTNIKLADHATIGGSGNWALIGAGYAATSLDLNGKTLTKAGTNTLTLINSTITAGNITIAGGTLATTNTVSNGSAAALFLDNTTGVSLALGNNFSIGSLAGGGTSGGNVTLGGNHLTVGALGTDTEFAGAISGTGGQLTKTGSGILTLAGTNSFTGATTVSAGTLFVSGSLGSSTVSVINAATLINNGTIAGTISTDSTATVGGNGIFSGAATISGTLSPGNSPGYQSYGGDLTLTGTATSLFELGGVNRSTTLLNGSGYYDAVDVTGLFTLDGTINVSLLNGFMPTNGNSFNLFDWGTIAASGFNTSTDLSLPSLDGGLTWDTSAFTSNGTITVIPEPRAALLGGLGLLALLRRRR